MSAKAFYPVFCLLLAVNFIGTAQTKRNIFLNHSLQPGRNDRMSNNVTAFPETLYILAAMVEFEKDDIETTTGDGSFDTSHAAKKVIDASPHDAAYFRNHLKFLENYFKKVSDGKLIIINTLLDSFYRLPHQMRYYSPSRSSLNNIELGRLMEDAWKKIDTSTIPPVQYNLYKAFLIFHAGAGRDIDLTAQYAYDPTPFDIPSIYINLSALKNMFGDSYRGVPVRNDSFYIRNSMIIPETESRGEIPFPLGINGLLAASVGSYLGLPDLFDTRPGYGESGIGRFGLMDGQSIFSWNGVFPPEPSAWEKYFLGWLNPLVITSGDTLYSLPAVSLNNQTDSVCKVLIDAKEYFLIENRSRDANRDGAKITLIYDGSQLVRQWARDTSNFNYLDQDSLYGVVVDVDEFDWSLPGYVDSRTHELQDGGILIWHIDEKIIDANYSTNSVNADPEHRGVNLMEADGSQDIGQSYGQFTVGSGSESGWPLDFWYRGNIAPLRKALNALTPASHPGSMSNNLANSHIYIGERFKGDTISLSYRGPRMKIRIKVGDETVKPLRGFPVKTLQPFINNSITVHLIDGILPYIFIPASDIYAWNDNGSASPGFKSSGVIIEPFQTGGGNFFGKPVVAQLVNDFNPEIVACGNFRIPNDAPAPSPTLGIWSLQDSDHDSLADLIFSAQLPDLVTASPVLGDTVIAVGVRKNNIIMISKTGSILPRIKINPADTSDIVGISLWNPQDKFIAVSSKGSAGIFTLSGLSSSGEFSHPMVSSPVTANFSAAVGKKISFATKDGCIYLVDSNFVVMPGFPVSTGGEILNSPAVADIDGDGQKDIVFFSGNKIFAFNYAGALIDNFPVTVSTNKTILTSPLITDINADGIIEIIAVTQEGLVAAYDKSGRMAGGFPLQSGVNQGFTPASFLQQVSMGIEIGLVVASADSNVYAWRTGAVNSLNIMPHQHPWQQHSHDEHSTGLDESGLTYEPKNNAFLPASLAYNWPNPVGPEHGFKTHIRYYIHSNANVTIKIFDLAGDLVTEFKGPGIGGLDNEVVWDVSDIQSGIYFARVYAQGTNETGTAVIKIAVIK